MSWTCPKCERELLKENQWHNCVKVSINSLFEGRSEDLVLAFDKILAAIADLPDVLISASKNCVVFVHRQTFLIIRPLRKELEVKFYSDQLLKEYPIKKSIPRSGRYENYIRISSEEDLKPIV